MPNDFREFPAPPVRFVSPAMQALTDTVRFCWVSILSVVALIGALTVGLHPIGSYFATAFALLAVLFYQITLAYNGAERFESWIRALTDLDAFKRMTMFDALCSHYGNVATVGLFLTVLVYQARRLFEQQPVIIPVLTTLALFVIMGVYTVQFAKLAVRFSEHRGAPLRYVVLSMAIFLFDGLALQILIKAVPR